MRHLQTKRKIWPAFGFALHEYNFKKQFWHNIKHANCKLFGIWCFSRKMKNNTNQYDLDISYWINENMSCKKLNKTTMRLNKQGSKLAKLTLADIAWRRHSWSDSHLYKWKSNRRLYYSLTNCLPMLLLIRRRLNLSSGRVLMDLS